MWIESEERGGWIAPRMPGSSRCRPPIRTPFHPPVLALRTSRAGVVVVIAALQLHNLWANQSDDRVGLVRHNYRACAVRPRFAILVNAVAGLPVGGEDDLIPMIQARDNVML